MIVKRILAVGLAFSLLAAVGCETIKENRTAQGALIGTGAGAGLGAIIGEVTTGDAGKGAIIGGLAGAALGTGIGYYLQKQKKDLERIPNARVVEEPYVGPYYEQPPNAPPVQTLSVTMSGEVLFDHDSDRLKHQAQASLNQLAAVLMDPQYPPPARVIITGHTDSTGNRQYNIGLSQRRADAVMRYLISQGVNPHILVAVGMGPDVPVADNATYEGRAYNRRVEIRIIPN